VVQAVALAVVAHKAAQAEVADMACTNLT
jgi:hypothetical protein